jgi:hypothetical protein
MKNLTSQFIKATGTDSLLSNGLFNDDQLARACRFDFFNIDGTSALWIRASEARKFASDQRIKAIQARVVCGIFPEINAVLSGDVWHYRAEDFMSIVDYRRKNSVVAEHQLLKDAFTVFNDDERMNLFRLYSNQLKAIDALVNAAKNAVNDFEIYRTPLTESEVTCDLDSAVDRFVDVRNQIVNLINDLFHVHCLTLPVHA